MGGGGRGIFTSNAYSEDNYVREPTEQYDS